MNARTIGSLFAVLMMSACSNLSNSDISSKWIVGKACTNCAGTLFIKRDGQIIDENYPKSQTVMDRNAVAGMLAWFPKTEMNNAARHMPAITSPSNVVILVVTYREGKIERAAIPTGILIYDKIGRLQRWTQAAAFEATSALSLPRRRTIRSAIRRHKLHSITLEMLGCYGWCPSYKATFSSSGRATIRDRGLRCDVVARANISFGRVLAAVSYNLAWLRPYYPISAVDTARARITVAIEHDPHISQTPRTRRVGGASLSSHKAASIN